MAVLLATAAGACGGSTKVGSGLETKTTSEPAAGCRLGECTTTTSAPPKPTSTTTTAPVKSTPTTKATTATAVAPSTTAVQTTSVFTIKIQSDNEPGGHFNPAESTVPRGSVVRWTNTDSLTRSVEAENGAFRSPPIAPGASWEFRTSAPGTFAYQDGTRPYAVGNLHVR